MTELGHEPVGAILIVVEVNELGNAENIFSTEGIGFAAPSGFENVHCFFVAFLADAVIGIESGLNTADTIQPTLLVIVDFNANVVIGF